MSDIDLTVWEYGGDATCPECEDNTLYYGIYPVWATDQCEMYEVMCPACGVIALDGDVLDNEAMDLFHHDLDAYFSEYYGDLLPLPRYDETPAHTGFYVQTEQGHKAHVLGDPNMSEETAKALAATIDCAVRWISEDDTEAAP